MPSVNFYFFQTFKRTRPSHHTCYGYTEESYRHKSKKYAQNLETEFQNQIIKKLTSYRRQNQTFKNCANLFSILVYLPGFCQCNIELHIARISFNIKIDNIDCSQEWGCRSKVWKSLEISSLFGVCLICRFAHSVQSVWPGLQTVNIIILQ